MSPHFRFDELLMESRALQRRLSGIAGLADDPAAELLAQLQRSGERLQLPTRSGKFGVWDYDIEANEAFWTESLYAIHGVAPDTFKCTVESFSTLVHPEDREKVEHAIQAALEQGEPYELEFRALRPDGEIIWLFTSAIVLRENDRPRRLLGLSVDITHRKQAEEALAEREAAYRNLVQSLPAAVYMCDLEGRLTLYNDAAVEMWGRQPSPEDRWCASYRLSYPDGREMPIEDSLMVRAIREGREIRGEEVIIHRPDGTARNVLPHPQPLFDSHGTCVGGLNVLADLTPYREAEGALAATRSELAWQVDALTRLHALASTLAQAPELEVALQRTLETLVEICGAHGGLLYLHQADSKCLSPAAATGIGDALAASLAAFASHCGESAVAHAFVERRTIVVEDATVHEMFAQSRQFIEDTGIRSALCTPILTRGGDVLGVVSVYCNTPRQFHTRDTQMAEMCALHAGDAIVAARAQAELREAKEHLERRVEERTWQLRALATELQDTESRERKRLARELHDNIQQILVAIKMHATMAHLGHGHDGMAQVIRLSEEALRECRALVIGLSPPVLQDADLPAALNWLARKMNEQHGLQVELCIQHPLPSIPEDLRSLLFEVTRELLFNVVKHAEVTEALVTLWAESENLCLEVLDRGRGCDFDVLARGNEESFGLFSIRERLNVLGGSFEADSAPGKGCRIVVCVPGREAEETEERVVDEAVTGDRPLATDATLRVLVADDHVMLRQGLAQMLSAQPDMHVIAQANDGVEAVDLARKLRPDFVLMDITMPNMSGIDATRRIAAELPDVRVVGLSMHDSDEMAAAMRNAGAIAFVNKAEAMEKLLSILRDEGRTA